MADGAGGTGRGAEAAQLVVDRIAGVETDAFVSTLVELDAVLRRSGGQTTAVAVSISSTGITGIGVGDSGAWRIDGSAFADLTSGQPRKPLVGAGCTPLAFHAPPLGHATLLVASDGLLRYASPADIIRTAGDADLDRAAARLVDLVRLPSGAVPDDVSVVLVRAQRMSVR